MFEKSIKLKKIAKFIINVAINYCIFIYCVGLVEERVENKIDTMLLDYNIVEYRTTTLIGHRECFPGSKFFRRLQHKLSMKLLFGN